MSLREIFSSRVRDIVYIELRKGILRDWKAEFIYKLANEAINDKQYEITSFLQNNIVTLENMSESARLVAIRIILPYIYQKRVE